MTHRAQDDAIPRFDLGSNLDPTNIKQDTIKSLLKEINHERKREELKRHQNRALHVHLGALRPALKFIEQITGRKIQSADELLSLSTLKVIKLLYVENDESGTQMYRLLTHPCVSKKPTLEFRTYGTALRNAYGTKLVAELLRKLEVEIDKDRLDKIKTFLLVNQHFQEIVSVENGLILEAILGRYRENPASVAESLKALNVLIDRFNPTKVNSTLPTVERVYTYLRCLEPSHFIGEEGVPIFV